MAASSFPRRDLSNQPAGAENPRSLRKSGAAHHHQLMGQDDRLHQSEIHPQNDSGTQKNLETRKHPQKNRPHQLQTHQNWKASKKSQQKELEYLRPTPKASGGTASATNANGLACQELPPDSESDLVMCQCESSWPASIQCGRNDWRACCPRMHRSPFA